MAFQGDAPSRIDCNCKDGGVYDYGFGFGIATCRYDGQKLKAGPVAKMKTLFL